MNFTQKNLTQFPQVVEIPKPLEIHPSVSPKAAGLLMEVARLFMIKPEAYNQDCCRINECGSPLCIIGHMMIMAGVKCSGSGHPTGEERVFVGEQLGLTSQQIENIFWLSKWPKKEAHTARSVTPSQGIARIEHFLATGE